MKKLIYLTILFIFSTLLQLSAEIERRAAIDIGSGGTKLAVADVDTETNQIIQILLDTSFSGQRNNFSVKFEIFFSKALV